MLITTSSILLLVWFCKHLRPYPSPSLSKTLKASLMSSFSSFSLTCKVLLSNMQIVANCRIGLGQESPCQTSSSSAASSSSPCQTSLWETRRSRCCHCHPRQPRKMTHQVVWKCTYIYLKTKQFWKVDAKQPVNDNASLIISCSSASVGFCPRDRITVASSCSKVWLFQLLPRSLRLYFSSD